MHLTIMNSYQGQTSLVKIFHSLSFLFYRITHVISQLVKYIPWNENSKGLSLTFTDLGQIQLTHLQEKNLDLSKIKLKASISQPSYGKLHYSSLKRQTWWGKTDVIVCSEETFIS